MNNINAQELIDKNLNREQERIISKDSLRLAEGEVLVGELIIQDYSNLKEINLFNHKLTSLTVINCPQLVKINVRKNNLTELAIEKVKIDSQGEPMDNEVEEIVGGSNELKTLDLIACQKIKRLILPDNPNLTKIKKLNLKSVGEINLFNSPPISFLEDYEELKQLNDTLFEMIRELDKADREKKLTLNEPIRTVRQTNEAIKRLLKKTENEWREYFESEDPKISEKKLMLGLSFEDYEERQKAKEILGWIIEARVNGDYHELVEKWNHGKEYNPEYDYDGSLNELIKYLVVRDIASRSENNNNKQHDRK